MLHQKWIGIPRRLPLRLPRQPQRQPTKHRSLTRGSRRLRLPLADDLRRYTFTVYLLHVLPVGLLRGLLYPRLAVDPALFSALLFLSGVLIPWAVGRMARRWIPSFTAGGRLSLRLLGL